MRILNLWCFLLFFTATPLAFSQVNLTIAEVQGSGLSSPVAGQLVLLDSVLVTTVAENGFYVQSRPGHEDNDSLTSEGLFIYLGNKPALNPGNLIQLRGSVQEYATETELSGFDIQWTILATDQDLPAPVILDQHFPSTQYFSIPQLERLEGMLVSFTDGIICGPGTSDRAAAFYLSEKRPFREAGIIAPGINGLPVWDNNPELIFFDAGFSGNNNERLASGMSLNATGVLGVLDDHYLFRPTQYQLSGELVDRRAREKEEDEISIGCLNALFLDSDSNPDNIVHRQQIAIYILEGMKAPNIVAVQEVENIQAMQDVANRIRELDPTVDYQVFLEKMPNSSINLGFFVDQSLTNIQLEQLGVNETLSVGGRMHDRPPFLLTAEFTTDPPTPIQVLNLHLKSLNGIEGSNADYVRTKRHEAAISVARMVQDRRQENLVVLGDFNGFTVSDGYVDVVNQISGGVSLGAERPVVPIVDPPLTSLTASVNSEDRYSYVYRGNAQVLDHCLSTELTGLEFRELQFIRGNADNPELSVNNPQTPQFSSDHDGFVAYFALLDTLVTVSNHQPLEFSGKVIFPNPYQNQQDIHFTPEQSDWYHYAIYSLGGKLLVEESLGFVAEGAEKKFHSNQHLIPGIYVLKINGTTVRYLDKIIVAE